MATQRIFMGWHGPLLERAAGWLLERWGEEQGDVVVALPGARAGRILEEALVRGASAGLVPPRIVTAGQLTDELLGFEGVSASRLVRTLAWERALGELDPAELRCLTPSPPERDDHARSSVLANEVRRLFGEVAAEGLDFAAVAASARFDDLPRERARWKALARAQEAMTRHLTEVGMHDPHLGRLAAIEAGRYRAPRQVVLVGVVERNALLRRTLEGHGGETTALVFAPESEAAGFDPHGGLVPAYWAERGTSLALEQWVVVDRPEDQADAALRAMASWRGRFRAEEITVGLADAEVSPYLAARLEEQGVRARDAAGVAMARTPLSRLVEAVASFLRARSYEDFAALLRHVDFESAVRARTSELEPIERLDRYHRRHLPWRTDGSWCADARDKRDQALRREMNELWSAVEGVLGELLNPDAAPVAEHARAVRKLLETVYGERELNPGVEEQRVLLGGLRTWADVLEELEGLPAPLAPEIEAAEVCALALRHACGRENDLPPAGAREGEPTIELMGWLELFLDDAPALVVTGFEDGKVPESLRGDAFLPNGLRRDLGLADSEQRLARDLYGCELLVQSRAAVTFVTGRRSVNGDPRLPSRVAFHCAPEEVAPRVRRFLSGAETRPRPLEGDFIVPRELPRLGEPPELEVMTVSAFGTYLESPYAYYLKHALGLNTLDDRARELDPLGFGNLTHEVLQRFGEEESLRDETDASRIASFLLDTLQTLGAELYGRAPLPAVRLQLEQLTWRLKRFAGLQADRRRSGWRIEHVEWTPPDGGVPLKVPGQADVTVKGRIDRIDVHVSSGRHAIWDYKTGDKVQKPLGAHRRGDGSWRDLQLPLYVHLAGSLLRDEPPEELGYISLGREDQGFWHQADWRSKPEKKEDLEPLAPLFDAFGEAQRVVRAIRAGELYDLGHWKPFEPILEALGGVGLIAAMASAGDAEELEEVEA